MIRQHQQHNSYTKISTIDNFKCIRCILENLIACHVLGGHDTVITACCLFNRTVFLSFPASNFNSKRMLFVRCNAVLSSMGHTVFLQISCDDLMAKFDMNIVTHWNRNDIVTHRAIAIDFWHLLGFQSTVLEGESLVCNHITAIEIGGNKPNGHKT